MDLKKIIYKARDYPDLVSWELGDPESYQLAIDQNILQRPEVQRHMDERVLSLITYDDVLGDARFKKSYLDWRRQSPLTYWAAVRHGWIDQPEIAQKLGRRRSAWDSSQIERSAKRYKTMTAWKENAPAAYAAAVKLGLLNKTEVTGHMSDLKGGTVTVLRLLLAGRTILTPDDFKRMSSPQKMRRALKAYQEDPGSRDLVKLAKDTYLVRPEAGYSPYQLQDFVIDRLRQECHLRLRPGRHRLARRFGLPYMSDKLDTFEATDLNWELSLDALHPEEEHQRISIRRRSKYWEPEFDGAPGDFIRAMKAMPAGASSEVAAALPSALERLVEEERAELYALRHHLLSPLRQALHAHLG
jgi:hypothetical protein